ncbi:MAG: hypothetical protein KDD75_23135 [Caldilineaceae bacterium]|nr:hypothetical protein [Caldilineaceae bacterium]
MAGDGATACTVGPATYALGARFEADDGCNTCTCTELGFASCTEIACVCEPKENEIKDSELYSAKVWRGKGQWEIEFVFKDDGTFTRNDLVSPCPADAVCFWSGIVTNSGSYTISGSTISLTYKDGGNEMMGVSLPKSLTAKLDCDQVRILTETTSDGKVVTYRRSED